MDADILDRFHCDCILLEPPYPETTRWNPRGQYTFKSPKGPYYMGEIWVGRFAEDLKSIEKWVRITENNRMDVFPDVWVDLKGLPQK